MGRSKKALINILASLLSEVVQIVCSFILPRLILQAFGSSYNGITASISQFIGCAALLRSGIGGVTRAALYEPLAHGDQRRISAIFNATNAFMQKISLIFAGALAVFSLVYPFTALDEFEYLFSATLVIVIGSSTFVDYYFGLTNQMLLSADQRIYVNTFLQILTTILNTIVAAILIYAGCNIHIVKLGSAAVFFIRPIVLSYYVRRRYKIDKSVPSDSKAISQRWDAFAHQIALFVNNNTDIIVLTLFADLKLVSVYTVYHLVTNGLYKIEKSFAEGMGAAFGDMLAKKEEALLQRNFRVFELLIYSMAAVLFICGGVLIVPFAEVYTLGVTDVSYSWPLFGALICLNQFFVCIRLPYQIVTEAAGHFKQTKNGAMLEAILHIILSVVFVCLFGLTGIAMGALVAMVFRTIQYSVYCSKNLLHRSIWVVIKRIGVGCIQVVVVLLVLKLVPVGMITNYVQWFQYAIVVGLVTALTVCLSSFVFFNRECKMLRDKAFSLVKMRRV